MTIRSSSPCRFGLPRGLDDDDERAFRQFLPRMPILFQQALREILAVFLLVLAVSTSLTTLAGVSMHLIDHGISGTLLLRVLPFIVPSMLPFTIPASFLLSVILVYGRMSGDSELTALQAAGVNIVRIMTLPVALAGVLSVLTFVLTDRVVPWAAARIEFAVMKHVEGVLVQQLSATRQAVYPPANLRISVAEMNGTWMTRPVIRLQTGQERHALAASAARLEIDASRQTAILHVRDATVFLDNGDRASLAGDHSFPISGPAFGGHMPNHFVTLSRIRERIDQVRRTIHEHQQQLLSGATANPDGSRWTIHYAQGELHKLHTEVHNRYALACSCLCFAMFGCPLAAVQSRGRLLANLLCCFLPIVGVYYTIVFGMAGQCRNGALDPAWAMWTGNALLIALAAWSFYRLSSR